ncbi:MAG: MarR family winged helix-turn-helix transcriptional regulator [Planctomycetota bacterium]
MGKNKEIAMRMNDVMRRMVHHHIRALSLPDPDTDLTRAQMATVVQIGREEQTTMGSLAEGLGIAPGSLTGVVDRLIEKNLVKRERDQADRRRVVVALSSGGKKVFERFQEGAARFADSLFSLLSPQESETLLNLMERLVKGMEKGMRGKPEG